MSVNTKTGDVTLWDAKYRSNEVTIQPSPTFERDASRANAIKQAQESIANNKTLPEDIQQKALENLRKGEVKTRTVGMGNAKNSRTE